MIERVDNVQALGIESVAPDLLRHEIQIGFSMADESVLIVCLPVGASARLLLQVQAVAAQFELLAGDDPVVGQPVRLQEVRPFGLADGRKGLVLKMGNLEVPLVLTNAQTEALKSELEQLPDLRIDSGHQH